MMWRTSVVLLVVLGRAACGVPAGAAVEPVSSFPFASPVGAAACDELPPGQPVLGGSAAPWTARASRAGDGGGGEVARLPLSLDRVRQMLNHGMWLIDDYRTMEGIPSHAYKALREQAAEIAGDVARLEAEPAGRPQGERLLQAYLAAARLEAEIARSNPLLDFDQLLVVRRSIGSPALGLPQNWQSNCALPASGFDNEIAILSLTAGAPVSTLYRPAQPVFVGDVDLHFDADRLLFSSIGAHGRWQVFEVGVDGTGLRQVTAGDQPDVNSYDACYLPDGRIVFSSTASFAAVPCVNGSTWVANLYRMDADGRNVRQLCFDQEHNWCPTMLPSGRVLYLRWEYTDTPHSHDRVLFHMNPDGTGQMEYYGSNSYWPNALFYARPIPDRPTKFVGIVGGHHGVPRMGELVIFDVARGRREADGVVQRIPGWGKKVEPVIADNLVDDSWPKFLHPYPLSDKYFLVAAQQTPNSLWGIYLVDVFDGMLLLREEPGFALLEPVPLRPTPRPPVLPDRVRPGSRAGLVYLSDIHAGSGLAGVPRGTVKQLRVLSYHYLYPGMGGPQGVVGLEGPWDIKRILGTVPVEADGSAAFHVPANTPISVQPLDAEGKAVQLMRSWFTAMPGEVLSCVGCHESQNSGPPNQRTLAMQRPPSEISPWYGPARGFNFAREVQPVLDKHCTGCHHGQPIADGQVLADLRGLEQISDYTSLYHFGGADAGHFSTSYAELHRYVRRPGLESDYHMLVPMEYHADTTRLVQLLQKGHHGVKLDAEAWNRLITWIDLNAPYHGTWTEIAGEARVQPLAQRRRELLKLYADVESDPEAIVNPPNTPGPPVLPELEPPVPRAPIRCDGWPLDTDAACRRQAALRQTSQSVDLGDGVFLDMVQVPAGEFIMGDDYGYPDERPRSVVRIARPFWIGRCEVTNAQYARFDPSHDSRVESKHAMQFGVRGFYVNGPQQPAVRLSWERASAFCKWLTQQTGRPFRLPTEAQWEYACRAGTDTAFFFGGAAADFSQHANVADRMLREFVCDPYSKVRAPLANPGKYDDWIPKDERFSDGGFVSEDVGRYQPNAWGLIDMHGNVAEWTCSAYRAYPYREDDGRNDPSVAEDRVARGGSWRDRPESCRSACRFPYRPYQPVYNVGFRVVCDEEVDASLNRHLLLRAGPSSGASAPDPACPRLDHAPFARVGGWSGRTPFDIEFHEMAPGDGPGGRAYDPFLVHADGLPHLGLQWEETRYVAEVVVTFSSEGELPPEQEMALQYWWLTWLNPAHVSPRVPGESGFSDDDCDDPYRGEWIRARTAVRREGRRIAWKFEPLGDEFPRDPRWKDYREPLRRTRMIRILFPRGARPRIAAIEVYGREGLLESDLFVEPGAGRPSMTWAGSLEVYNGKLLGATAVGLGAGDSVTPDGTFRLRTGPGKGIRVRLLRSDVGREDHARTILTVRGPETFSFLPQDADGGEKIHVPDLGVFAASVAGGWTHAKLIGSGTLKLGEGLLDRVLREPEQSLERAFREVPGLAKISPDGNVARYIPIGAGNHWERFLVKATGSVFCKKSMLTLVRDQKDRLGWAGDEIQVEVGGGDPPWFPREDADTSQIVEEGRLPIVRTRWKAGGLAFDSAAFQTTVDGPIRGGLRGDEPTCGIVVIGWRWPEGGSRKAARLSLRITPVEECRLSGGAVLVRAARLSGKEGEEPLRTEYPRERLRLAVHLGGPGSVDLLREDPRRPGAQIVSIVVEPKAGETERRVAWTIPFTTAETTERIRAVMDLDPFRALDEVRSFWRERLSEGARLEVPDRKVAEFFDSVVGHVIVSGFRDSVTGLCFAPCASVQYGALVNEGCYEVEFLDQRGLHADARRYLEGILECQGSQTLLPGRFRSSKEVFHALRLPDGASYGEWEYAVSHGFALVTAANHFRYTGDAAWLSRYAPRLVAGAEWILREREATKRTRPCGQRVWEWGLTPAARLNDNVDWRYWYVINAYQVAGVQAVASVLGEIRHPASQPLAEGARAYREDLLAAVQRSIELSPVVKLRDETWVPHVPIAPYLRGRSSPEIDVGYGGTWLRDVCYSPIFLASTGVLEPEDRIISWILRDHEDNVFMDPKLRHLPAVPPDLWFSQGGLHNWPAGTDYPVIYCRRGEVPAALRYLYNSFAMLLFRDTNHFSEHVFEFGAWPTSPLFKTSDEAAWLLFFRALLIREEGHRLILNGGAPRAWLADGREVSIRGAATYFGPAGFRIRSRADAGRIEAEVDPPARRPEVEIQLVLRHPRKAPIRSVLVNGKPWRDFDPARECVTLKPTGPGRLSVEAEY